MRSAAELQYNYCCYNCCYSCCCFVYRERGGLGLSYASLFLHFWRSLTLGFKGNSSGVSLNLYTSCSILAHLSFEVGVRASSIFFSKSICVKRNQMWEYLRYPNPVLPLPIMVICFCAFPLVTSTSLTISCSGIRS
jgi:hypothetical protein